MPDRSRPYALGWLQALSAIGNMAAALITLGLGLLAGTGALGEFKAWRIVFVIGTLPALLAVAVFRRLKEPEKWREAAAKRAAPGFTEQPGEKLGSYRDLFGHPRWRHNTFVGMTLAFSGVVGLWAIGFFSPDLTCSVFRKTFTAQGLPEAIIESKLTTWSAIASLLLNAGGFFGVYAMSKVTQVIGRRRAFTIGFVLAASSTAMVFGFMRNLSDIFWMIPLMGFCQLTLFGGYAIYLPELFPTRLRSTGVSFCYNVGRLVAAIGPTMLGLLTSQVFVNEREPMRYAGVTMCSVFLIGLIALPFAPETKGKPLPEWSSPVRSSVAREA
jgi:hypothetical protein